VTRALLIAAMVISLWPLGLVLMVSGGEDDATVSHPAPVLSGGGKPSSARPELEEIASHARELNEHLADEELYAGEPRYDLAYEAREIEEELFRWRRQSRGEASKGEERVARRLVDLTQAIADLSESPSQQTLRPYNRALRRFNVAVSGR
jgi:hypothetical protein